MWSVCAWMQAPESPEGGIRSLELELQAAVSGPMWMPGTELRSYTQQLRTFNHGAISLAPSLGFKGISTLIPVEAGLVCTPTGSVHEVPVFHILCQCLLSLAFAFSTSAT